MYLDFQRLHFDRSKLQTRFDRMGYSLGMSPYLTKRVWESWKIIHSNGASKGDMGQFPGGYSFQTFLGINSLVVKLVFFVYLTEVFCMFFSVTLACVNTGKFGIQIGQAALRRIRCIDLQIEWCGWSVDWRSHLWTHSDWIHLFWSWGKKSCFKQLRHDFQY